MSCLHSLRGPPRSYSRTVAQPEMDELAARAAAGDRSALEELLVRHLPTLRAYVRLRMGPGLRGMERESDLVQSVCREVLFGAERFRFGESDAFKAWLYTTLVRKISDRQAYHHAACRDGGQRVEAEDSELLDTYGRFVAPSQAAGAAEQLAAP